jgi:DNA replication protein DnaC
MDRTDSTKTATRPLTDSEAQFILSTRIRQEIEAIRAAERERPAAPPRLDMQGLIESIKEKYSRAPSTMDPPAPPHMSEEFVKTLLGDLGYRYSPERASLDTFKVDFQEQHAVINRLAQFDISTMTGNGSGIIFIGSVGTGKDHLMAALLYEAANRGINTRHLAGQDFYGAIRDRMDTGEKEEKIIACYERPRLLAISDPAPPVGELSAWRMELLYRLIDRRYRNLKPTWVTLNARTREEAEKKLSSQVWDRLQDRAEIVECFWPSYRERQ